MNSDPVQGPVLVAAAEQPTTPVCVSSAHPRLSLQRSNSRDLSSSQSAKESLQRTSSSVGSDLPEGLQGSKDPFGSKHGGLQRTTSSMQAGRGGGFQRTVSNTQSGRLQRELSKSMPRRNSSQIRQSSGSQAPLPKHTPST